MPVRLSLDDNRIIDLYNGGLTSIQIGKILNISKPTVLRRLKEHNIKMRPSAWEKQHNFTENYFSILTSSSCYWAGFIAADGWVSSTNYVSIELDRIDENHLKKFCQIVNRDIILSYRIKKQKSGKISNLCILNLGSLKMTEDLKNNFNIVERKSLILQPPKINDNILIKHFIRGYFDGDGCISVNKSKRRNKSYLSLAFCIVSGSKIFLEWIKAKIKENVEDIGNPKIFRRKNTNTYYLCFGGNKQVPKIMNWLYQDSNESICLDRKYTKYQALLQIIGGKL